MSANYQQLKEGEIVVGQPVPWPLYDGDHKLLLARGARLESAHQLSALITAGLYRVAESVSDGAKVLASSPKTASEASKAATEASTGGSEGVCQLEDIRLGIGDALQLQGRTEADSSRYYVKLIGFFKGKAVLVSNPVVNGHMVLLREGQGFVVRLFAGKSAYAFATSVIRVTNVPFPHVYLDYPKEVRGLVVRRGARARVQLIAAVAAEGGRNSAATMGDLSVGGAMLTAKAPLADRNGTVAIKFRVVVNGVEQYLTIKGIIRSIRAEPAPGGGETQYQHGVQFVDMPAAEQVALSGFVYQTLFEQSAEV